MLANTSRQSGPRRVIGYVRVSTDEQADQGVSLEAQKARLAAYAALYDLDVVEVVVDAGVSAKTLDRPGLGRVLGMLDAGEASGILVAKLDRLTRSVRDLGDLVDRLFADGRHALLSVAENIDTRTAGGRLVLNVLGSVAQWEREAVGERTAEALAHLKAQGIRLGGEALGWRRAAERDGAGRLVVLDDDAEAATVRRILKLRRSGCSLRGIAAILSEERRPTKNGGQWHASTISRVLAREEGCSARPRARGRSRSAGLGRPPPADRHGPRLLEECSDRHPKRVGQLDESRKGEVGVCQLDPAEVLHRDLEPLRELLLRPPMRRPQLGDPPSYSLGDGPRVPRAHAAQAGSRAPG